jgi:hypothetical protein
MSKFKKPVWVIRWYAPTGTADYLSGKKTAMWSQATADYADAKTFRSPEAARAFRDGEVAAGRRASGRWRIVCRFTPVRLPALPEFPMLHLPDFLLFKFPDLSRYFRVRL